MIKSPPTPASDTSETMSRSVRASARRRNEAGSRAHCSASSHGCDRRGSDVQCPAALPCAHELDEAELVEDAHVVGDVAQWCVERARELRRTRLAARAQSLEDALSQRVRERLGEIRIERPTSPGILAAQETLIN